MSRLVDGDLNHRATNDDPSTLILVVVMRTALVHVSPAAVFLGLARRQSAIAPTGLFPAAPSRRTIVAISVHTIFISVAAVPAPVVVPILLLSLLVFVFLPVIRHQCGCAQGGQQSEYCQHAFAHKFLILSTCIRLV